MNQNQPFYHGTPAQLAKELIEGVVHYEPEKHFSGLVGLRARNFALNTKGELVSSSVRRRSRSEEQDFATPYLYGYDAGTGLQTGISALCEFQYCNRYPNHYKLIQESYDSSHHPATVAFTSKQQQTWDSYVLRHLLEQDALAKKELIAARKWHEDFVKEFGPHWDRRMEPLVFPTHTYEDCAEFLDQKLTEYSCDCSTLYLNDEQMVARVLGQGSRPVRVSLMDFGIEFKCEELALA